MRAGAQLILIPLVLGLAGCAPIPVEQAERACLADARDATGPCRRITSWDATRRRSFRTASSAARGSCPNGRFMSNRAGGRDDARSQTADRMTA
jgi:hypothetical protein